MTIIFSLILTLSTPTIFGNINFVQFDKIPDSEKYSNEINFIIDNEGYYNHWQSDWKYDVSKKSLVKGLTQMLPKRIEKLTAQN